jgi:hypothetical protein
MNCLLPLEHWDRGFESHSRHGCLCAFIQPCDGLITRIMKLKKVARAQQRTAEPLTNEWMNIGSTRHMEHNPSSPSSNSDRTKSTILSVKADFNSVSGMYSPIVYRYFGGKYCFYFQDQIISQISNEKTSRTGYLPGLPFDYEDGGSILTRNISKL